MLARIRFLPWGLAVLTLLLFGASAFAEWRVDIESKTVNPNQTGVTVAIKAYWDIDLYALTVPVIVRSVSGDAFWSLPLPVDTAGGPVVGVEWNWSNPGWANLVENVMPGPPQYPAAVVAMKEILAMTVCHPITLLSMLTRQASMELRLNRMAGTLLF